jgi:hypothetical protein
MTKKINIMPRTFVAVIWGFFFGAAVAVADIAFLTHDNYTSFLETNNLVLVEFVAPW